MNGRSKECRCDCKLPKRIATSPRLLICMKSGHFVRAIAGKSVAHFAHQSGGKCQRLPRAECISRNSASLLRTNRRARYPLLIRTFEFLKTQESRSCYTFSPKKARIPRQRQQPDKFHGLGSTRSKRRDRANAYADVFRNHPARRSPNLQKRIKDRCHNGQRCRVGPAFAFAKPIPDALRCRHSRRARYALRLR